MFLPLAMAVTTGCLIRHDCLPFLPCRVVYDRGFVRGFSTMGTPVRPGVSRVFGRFTFGSSKPAEGKKPLMAELMARLPHWVFIRNKLADQDTVVNVKQVHGDLLVGRHVDRCKSIILCT